MDYDELHKLLVPTVNSILEQVDEYTLYCFYTKIDELKLQRPYSCPYRQDNYPSFSIYKTKYDIGVEYYWKDSATGESGNIFKLIQKIESLTNIEEVFQKINEDFGLNYNLPVLQQSINTKIKLYNPPKESLIKLRVSVTPFTESGLAFWNQFKIDEQLLDFYKTKQINSYWSYKEQTQPYLVNDPTFAYRIGEYYQTYSPFANKTYKFRNDFPDNYFFGYIQLSKQGEKLLLDKSCKDVIFCRRLGYEAVCGKSETTMISEKKMLEFKERYKTVYLMLDNDLAGKTQVDKYIQKYPWLQVRFIPETLAKDKTDLCKKVGFEKTKEILNNLIR